MSEGPAVRLRPGVPQDAERFALAGQATFLESYAGLLPVEDILAHGQRQHGAQVYANWLADPAWRGWLVEAVEGAAPVGYLRCRTPMSGTWRSSASTCCIASSAVDWVAR
jgi:hypothetical protein